MHVALVGPCSPGDVGDLLDETAAVQARRTIGYRGVPVSDLARGLVAAGHQVTVITLTYRPDEREQEFIGPGLRVLMLKARSRPREYLGDLYRAERNQISASIRDVAPDIVNAHWTYEFELGAAESGIVHVTTAHDSPVAILSWSRDWYRAARLVVAVKASRGIDSLSAVSPYLQGQWSRRMRFKGPLITIPNSMPADAASEPRRPDAFPVLLAVGDAGRRKNVRTLLAAFADVKRTLPAATLRLVGPGLGTGQPLHDWARNQSLDVGVDFIGSVTRRSLAEEYARAWLLVHPAREEACPMAVLEAHAAGVPVLGGRNSGGVPYALGWGRAGWLTDVSDPVRLGASITKLVGSGAPELLPGWGDYVNRHFTPHVVVHRYLGWYDRTLA